MRDLIDFTYDHEGFTLLLNGVAVSDELFAPLDFALGGTETEQFIFTCSCGCPGCAGWHFGVKVKVRKHTVEWRTKHPGNDLRSSSLRSFYSFDKQQYDQVRARVLVALFDLARRAEQGEFPDLVDEDGPDLVDEDGNDIRANSDIRSTIQDLVKDIEYGITWRQKYGAGWNQKKHEEFYSKVLQNIS